MSTIAYKYRIYPNKEQQEKLAKTFGCVRFVWNNYVETFNSYNKETNSKPIYQNTTELRSEFSWLKDVSYAAVQQKIRDFEEFKTQYFSKSRKKKVGRPNFKRRTNNQSFRLTKIRFYIKQNKIWLEKIGHVEIQLDRLPKKTSKFLSVTISKSPSGKYFASILVEEEVAPRFVPTEKSIGLDLGLKEFLILSNGEKIENPRWFRKSQAKLRKTQKNLSRKMVGSSRYKKTRIKVARVHEKIANQRSYFHHNISLDLIKRFDFIGIESLNVAGMVKNGKLAKSISDAGWCQFISFLKYKAIWNQKTIQAISQWFPSSKTCNECGCVNDELTLKDREWECPHCHAVQDRDINAAKNIEKIALEIAQGVACAQRMQSRCETWTPQAIGNEASKKSDFKEVKF
jgi:putative transposase